MVGIALKYAVEQALEDLKVEAEARRFTIDEFLRRAADSIESVLRERAGVESCIKRFHAAGDQWARLFLECTVPGKPEKLVVRVPLYFTVNLADGRVYGPGYEEVLILESER